MTQVIAFKANDGSLHGTLDEKETHEDTLKLGVVLAKLASGLEESAEFVDDWNAHAIAGDFQMKLAITALVKKYPNELQEAIDLQAKINRPRVAVGLKSAKSKEKKS